MRRYNKGIAILVWMLIATCLLTGCSKDEETISVSQTDSEIIVELESTVDPTEAPTTTPTIEPTAEPTEASMPTPTIEPTEESTAAPVSTEQTSEVAETPDSNEASSEPSQGMFDPWYSVETSIAYSSGTDSDWSYGNQRKEFTVEKPCYVRIGSSIVADWHWGWRYGEGSAITITYRFTGAQNCQIEVSDGFVTSVPSEDPNVLIFTRVLTAKSEHEEDVVVFRYEPIQVGSISLEVIYDNQIKSQFDERNTVYFIENDW